MIHLFLTIAELDDEWANESELDLRSKIEEEVQRRGIGEIGGSGSGLGEMDLSVLVEDASRGMAALNALVAELGLADRSTIEVIEDPDEAEEDRRFLKALGLEIGPRECRNEACTALCIRNSVFCKVHHFHQIIGRYPIRR